MKYSLDLLMKGEPLELRRGTEKFTLGAWRIFTPCGYSQPVLGAWCDYKDRECYFDPNSGQCCEDWGSDLILAHPDKPEQVHVNLVPDGSARWYHNKEVADAASHIAFAQVEAWAVLPLHAKGRQS